MKSIFSLAIICAFAVSTICMTGCSDPAPTTTTHEQASDMKDKASEMEDKAMDMKDKATDMKEDAMDMKHETSHGSGDK